MKKSLLFLLFSGMFATPSNGQPGLIGEYYAGSNFEKKKVTRTDPRISFFWNSTAPARGIRPDAFSVRWRGKIEAPKSGEYHFSAKVDDGIRVKIGGTFVIDAWSLNNHVAYSGAIRLEAGQRYDLEVEYFNGMREGEIQLNWQLPVETSALGSATETKPQLIDASYFFQPDQPARSTKLSTRRAKTKKQQTPANPPHQKRHKATKTALLPKDTLDAYVPNNILFVQSKSEMLPDAYPALDQLAAFLSRNPKYQLTIEGHTDQVGNETKNLELSEQRAAQVAAYLTGKGIEAVRIRAIGYGSAYPLAKSTKATGNARNRRVTFQLNPLE